MKREEQESALIVHMADGSRWSDLLALWDPSSGCDGCWCFNHHIEPGQPDVRGDAAREAKRRLIDEGRAHGAIAYLDGRPAGWMAVDLGPHIPGHDCADQFEDAGTTWVVHCFYVDPASRGRGIARALLRSTLARLREIGARRVEAFPQPRERPALFNAFCGPFELFRQEGFQQVGADLGADYCRVARDLV